MKKEENKIQDLIVKDDTLILKAYKEPELVKLGSMQKHTLSGDSGFNDSDQITGEDPNP